MPNRTCAELYVAKIRCAVEGGQLIIIDELMKEKRISNDNTSGPGWWPHPSEQLSIIVYQVFISPHANTILKTSHIDLKYSPQRVNVINMLMSRGVKFTRWCEDLCLFECVIKIYLLQKLCSYLSLPNVKMLKCNWTVCGLALSLMLV